MNAQAIEAVAAEAGFDVVHRTDASVLGLHRLTMTTLSVILAGDEWRIQIRPVGPSSFEPMCAVADADGPASRLLAWLHECYGYGPRMARLEAAT